MPGSEVKEVALPSTRPLKRSASTVSLPTPPRTLRRRKNAKTRRVAPVLSDDDSDVGEGGRTIKRRKISSIKEDEDQEAFWAADSDDRVEQGSTKPKSTMSEPEMSLAGFNDDSDSETTSFLSRRRSKQSVLTTGSAPPSPPPSYRRPRAAKVVNLKTTRQIEKTLKVVVEEREEEAKKEETDEKEKEKEKEESSSRSIALPATPKTPKAQIRSGISPMMLLRDSPENPFLSSPESPSGTGPSTASASVASARGKDAVLEEQPFVHMVFRGVRKAYPNPYYDHKRGRPKSPDPNSLLPPEHPDYSPDLRGQPKMLWPSKKSKVAPEEPKTPTKKPLARTTAAAAAAAASLKTPPLTRKRTTGKTRSLVDSDDEEDEEQGLDEDEILPVRPLRLFTEKSS